MAKCFWSQQCISICRNTLLSYIMRHFAVLLNSRLSDVVLKIVISQLSMCSDQSYLRNWFPFSLLIIYWWWSIWDVFRHPNQVNVDRGKYFLVFWQLEVFSAIFHCLSLCVFDSQTTWVRTIDLAWYNICKGFILVGVCIISFDAFVLVFVFPDSRFTQQELPACKPILTPGWVQSTISNIGSFKLWNHNILLWQNHLWLLKNTSSFSGYYSFYTRRCGLHPNWPCLFVCL